MSQITNELIDALLSPTSNPNAESQYKSFPVPIRVQSLLSILQQSLLYQQQQQQQQQQNPNIPRLMLSSVLLRREVSSLGSYSIKNIKLTSEWEIVRLLGEMIHPLLKIFHVCGGNSLLNNVRRMIGFVIAQVCSTLSVMEEGISLDVMNVILDSIAQGCSILDKASLNLLSSLAQLSPLSLMKAKGTHLPSLLQSSILTLEQQQQVTTNHNNDNSSTHQLQCIQSILESMIHISIALDMPLPQSSSLSDNPKERMVQMIQIMNLSESTFYNKDPKKLSIHPSSNAASIGKVCLPTLLNVFLSIIENNKNRLIEMEDQIQNIMQTFSQCASSCPSLLVGHNDMQLITMLLNTLLYIGENTNIVDANVRLSSLEALVTLCMVPDVTKLIMENEMIRKLCLVGQQQHGGDDKQNGGVVGVCAELLVKGVDDDVETWAADDVALQDDEQWENDDVSIFAEMVLNIFLQHGGGGSQSLPIVLSYVQMLLQSKEWQNLKAGLTLLEACLTSSPHAFAVHVPVAIEAALNFCNHPCVRVQYQAIQVIGSLCENSSYNAVGGVGSSSVIDLRRDYGQRMLEAISQLLSSPCSKVASHACLSIVSFCRGGNGIAKSGSLVIDSSYILPYVGDVLQALASGPLSLDVMTNIVLYIRAFASIACLADVAGKEFAQYYESVVPGLLQCLSYGLQRDQSGAIIPVASSSHEIVSLRGAAIEALTIAGKAIGSEEGRFQSEAKNIMELVVSILQTRSLNSDTPPLIPQDQLLAAAARVSSLIGDDYTPYVPIVLPHLLKVATEKADVSVGDGDLDTTNEGTEFDEETGIETITMNLPGMGVKKLTLNTSQMQEKALVARVVYEHAFSMGATFGPYASDCFEAFLPLLDFKYSAEVRATAAQATSQIFNSAVEYAKTNQNIQQNYLVLLAETFSKLLMTLSAQLQTEEADDYDTLIAMSESLSEICYSAFANKYDDGSHVACLSITDADKFTCHVLKLIGDSLKRRFDGLSVLENSFDDDQRSNLEESLKVESEVLTNLVDSIGYNLKSLKEQFVPIFEKHILPAFSDILTDPNYNDTRARFSALCLFCDSVEHCGAQAAARYGPALSQAVSLAMNDSINRGDVELKEVSVYSIAQIARYAPAALGVNLGTIAPQLMSIAKEGEFKNKDEIEDLRLVENSVSALATLSLFSSSPFSNLDGLSRMDLVKLFLSNLPLGEDIGEAKFCHEGLCELVENGTISITQNTESLIKVIGGIAAALAEDEEVATKETSIRLVTILRQMQQSCDQLIVQQAFVALSPEAQNGINLLLN